MGSASLVQTEPTKQETRDGKTNVMGWDLDLNWGTAGT